MAVLAAQLGSKRLPPNLDDLPPYLVVKIAKFTERPLITINRLTLVSSKMRDHVPEASQVYFLARFIHIRTFTMKDAELALMVIEELEMYGALAFRYF